MPSASKSKNMSPEHMDLYLAFVMRERRILKSRETSFPAEELASAEKQVRAVVREARVKIKKKEEFEQVIAKPAKRRQLGLDILRKCKGMTRKQVLLIMDNFALFEEVLNRSATTQKVVLPDPSKGDAFYVPKKHNYR